MSPYYVPEELTKNQIKEWLHMAMCSEFNIYKDSNKIIALLCYELLNKWDDKK